MSTIIREIHSRSILSKSKIFDYVVNPYVGCQHGCTYCYARFMKKFTGHKEPWGQFVDVKINAPNLLQQEISKKHGEGMGERSVRSISTTGKKTRINEKMSRDTPSPWVASYDPDEVSARFARRRAV